ncbi:MAG: helix-turn-helix domain-containing protein [Gemmatimonadetes bacterium]|nr:MAG: helix-turn-helix domain-containing protein [Gemmatimonadota bacterium]
MLGEPHDVAQTASWARLDGLLRERPATAAVVDLRTGSGTLPGALERLLRLRATYPSVGLVVVEQGVGDPELLFELGRCGFEHLILLDFDRLDWRLRRAAAIAAAESVLAPVMRALGPGVHPREAMTVRLAFEAVQRRWTAEELARHVGLSRPHLSVRLRAEGLPSAGRLLTWARLLHAGRWLTDPGRSAESVSRQLEYASGSGFRRALRTFLGLTPSEVIEQGGLDCVLRAFLAECALRPRIARLEVA